MLHRLAAKIMLFAVVWNILAAEFGFSGDTAFVLAVLLTFLTRFFFQCLGQVMHMIRPAATAALVQGTLWLILFWWMAPAWARELPNIAIAFGAVLLGLFGGRCRQLAEANRLGPIIYARADRSLLIFGAVLGCVFGGLFALRYWGSLWPLIGYALLPGLPFRLGWQLAPLAAPDRTDAHFGDHGTFEDAGVSGHR